MSDQELIDRVHDAIRTETDLLNVFDVRRIVDALRGAGLHIVTEAERKVLDACAAPERWLLDEWSENDQGPRLNAIAKAELARRTP